MREHRCSPNAPLNLCVKLPRFQVADGMVDLERSVQSSMILPLIADSIAAKVARVTFSNSAKGMTGVPPRATRSMKAEISFACPLSCRQVLKPRNRLNPKERVTRKFSRRMIRPSLNSSRTSLG